MSGGKASATAAPGATQKVAVTTVTAAFQVDPVALKPLLARPARSLTLEEAALVVAHLHEAGFVALCEPYHEDKPLAPRYAADGSALVYPGPDPNAHGRFTVSIGRTLRSPVPDQPIELRYKATSTSASLAQPLSYVDVRQVVVLYHLAHALASMWDVVDVKQVLHAGIAGQPFARPAAGARLHDAHRSGRAIDFAGVVITGEDGKDVELLVATHWGGVKLPPGARPAVARGTKASRPADWATYAANHAEGWNWIELNWKVIEALKAQGKLPKEASADSLFKEHAALGAFTQTFFRLPVVKAQPGGDTFLVRQAQVVFARVYEVLARHCTLHEGAATTYDPTPADDASAGLGAPGGPFATRGSVLHPDHPSPILRANHMDHVHANVGPLGYEFPSAAAADADLKGAADDAERAARAKEQGAPRRLAPRGPAPAIVVKKP